MPPSYDDSAEGGYRKPRPDLYTVFLLIAFLALAVGAAFLFLEAADYGPTPAGRPSVQTSFDQASPVAPLAPASAVAAAVSCRGLTCG